MAALKKKADDDDAPRPELAPIAPDPTRDQLKLRKTSLIGAVTWDTLPEKLEANVKHDFLELKATVEKMFGNVLANPGEAKYRKIRHTNPNFTAKVYSCKGAPELFEICGFKKDVLENGFLILPEEADVSLLQRGLDVLSAHAEARVASEEKKRKLDAENARKAREARAQKAAEEAQPAAYDAAVAGASQQMVDEDEAMVAAIEAYFDAHPEANTTGTPFDNFDVERQVAGPGGAVIASVAASAGIAYHDLVCHMRRSEGGEWSVSKVEISS